MMNYNALYDWRNRRNIFNKGPLSFSAMHYSMNSYSTIEMKKTEIHFGDPMLINRLHNIPNPLQKNLADTLPSAQNRFQEETTEYTKNLDNKGNMGNHLPSMDNVGGNRSNQYSSFSGIKNMISGVFNLISESIFQRRAKSPTTQYYDCFDSSFDMYHEGSPPFDSWQLSKSEDQNKSVWAGDKFSNSNENTHMNSTDMTDECHAAAEHCEDKLNQVRRLLSNTILPRSLQSQVRRRARKVFVEPSQIEDSFEDTFSSEEYLCHSNESYVDYITICNNHNQQFVEIDAPKTKTETCTVQESKSNTLTNLSETEKSNDEKSVAVEQKILDTKSTADVSSDSCENKVSKLKALFKERCKANKETFNLIDSVMEPVLDERCNERSKTSAKPIPTSKSHNKHHKNPHKLYINKQKSQLRRNIEDDMLFVWELDSANVSSSENSPCIHSSENSPNTIMEHKFGNYFDEINGRFYTGSKAESDDSFQIVFTDSPVSPRPRLISDCESEDSFIIFEDHPDTCYTSTDVFGEESDCDDNYDESTESSDSESDCSDSDLIELKCRLPFTLSKSVADLTDDSLYNENTKDKDEIDCAFLNVCKEIPSTNISLKKEIVSDKEDNCTGLLMTETKRLKRKNLPPKQVQFSTEPPKVHVMRVWAFAARKARAGHWEEHARDRERFKRRIADVDVAVSWVLKPQHRSRIMFQRFMPWWNAQKRALAEKKENEDKLIVDNKSVVDVGRKKSAKEADKIICNTNIKEDLNSDCLTKCVESNDTNNVTNETKVEVN